MATVTIHNLDKTYPSSGKNPEFRAVKSINLEINDGEFMVLVGPSGCGKSTTLRMIAGLEKITAGTIHIDGVEVNDLLPKDRGIAMVFQNYALYPHLSLFENMAFGLRLAHTPKDEIQRRVTDAAKILGLEKILDRKPAALSGGQRQRVAVGRAIVRNPKVFLFDEPLSNLDAKMRVQMRSEISKLHLRLGTTMIYVTHDQVEAMTMGDRICVMKDGLIMQVADPLTLYHQPDNLFVAGFIGSPPMNLLRGRIQKNTTNNNLAFVETPPADNPAAAAAAVTIPLNGPLAQRAANIAPDKDVVLGIRPENIHEHPHTPENVPLQAAIDLAEPMGAETNVYLKTATSDLIARLHTERLFNSGEQLTVHLNLAKAHLFDAATEQVIR
ncbi:ABC transporter ATP-binding protein [Geminisphaera colitermitum]|uniref:ABC transporter ATP-binding protein n=1 Tax=Geminisphaera colitermitum TaxID=1148786 RepID=UPI0005BAE556|nr:sn-glycerol-3-phosphate ABC transporter ATP-binding protein UgpC [Geminisphaera colitermitum]